MTLGVLPALWFGLGGGTIGAGVMALVCAGWLARSAVLISRGGRRKRLRPVAHKAGMPKAMWESIASQTAEISTGAREQRSAGLKAERDARTAALKAKHGQRYPEIEALVQRGRDHIAAANPDLIKRLEDEGLDRQETSFEAFAEAGAAITGKRAPVSFSGGTMTTAKPHDEMKAEIIKRQIADSGHTSLTGRPAGHPGPLPMNKWETPLS